MISLPVFPPCTPGNFVPELRTLAPVNHKINSNTVIVMRIVMKNLRREEEKWRKPIAVRRESTEALKTLK